jgi:TP901 family phage tail tape measure protein
MAGNTVGTVNVNFIASTKNFNKNVAAAATNLGNFNTQLKALVKNAGAAKQLGISLNGVVNSSKKLATQQDKNTKSYRDTSKGMKVIDSSMEKLDGRTGRLITTYHKVGDSMVATNKVFKRDTPQSLMHTMKSLLSFQSFLGKMVHYISFTFGVQFVMTIQKSFQEAVESFKKFERAATNAATVAGYVGESFGEAQEHIMSVSRILGRTTVFSATEAADAFYQLASAGNDVLELTEKELTPILQYAAATQSELEEATEAVQVAMKAFGLSIEDTERIVDTFTGTITNSFMTFEKMKNAMRYVAPIAGTVGVSIEETASAAAILADTGLTGAQAGQRLNMILTKLLKPTEEARDMLTSMGLTVQDIDPQMNSLVEILYKLRAAGFDASNAAEMFRARTAASATVLVNSVDDIASFKRELQGVQGITETVAKKQIDTLWGSIILLGDALQEASIGFGESLKPMLVSLADFVKGTLLPTLKDFGGFLSTYGPMILDIAKAFITYKVVMFAVSKAIVAAYGAHMLYVHGLKGTFSLLLNNIGLEKLLGKVLSAQAAKRIKLLANNDLYNLSLRSSNDILSRRIALENGIVAVNSRSIKQQSLKGSINLLYSKTLSKINKGLRGFIVAMKERHAASVLNVSDINKRIAIRKIEENQLKKRIALNEAIIKGNKRMQYSGLSGVGMTGADIQIRNKASKDNALLLEKLSGVTKRHNKLITQRNILLALNGTSLKKWVGSIKDSIPALHKKIDSLKIWASSIKNSIPVIDKRIESQKNIIRINKKSLVASLRNIKTNILEAITNNRLAKAIKAHLLSLKSLIAEKYNYIKTSIMESSITKNLIKSMARLRKYLVERIIDYRVLATMRIRSIKGTLAEIRTNYLSIAALKAYGAQLKQVISQRMVDISLMLKHSAAMMILKQSYINIKDAVIAFGLWVKKSTIALYNLTAAKVVDTIKNSQLAASLWAVITARITSIALIIKKKAILIASTVATAAAAVANYFLSSSLTVLSTTAGLATKAISALGAALTFLFTTPVGWVILAAAAVVGLSAAVIHLMSSTENYKATLNDMQGVDIEYLAENFSRQELALWEANNTAKSYKDALITLNNIAKEGDFSFFDTEIPVEDMERITEISEDMEGVKPIKEGDWFGGFVRWASDGISSILGLDSASQKYSWRMGQLNKIMSKYIDDTAVDFGRITGLMATEQVALSNSLKEAADAMEEYLEATDEYDKMMEDGVENANDLYNAEKRLSDAGTRLEKANTDLTTSLKSMIQEAREYSDITDKAIGKIEEMYNAQNSMKDLQDDITRANQEVSDSTQEYGDIVSQYGVNSKEAVEARSRLNSSIKEEADAKLELEKKTIKSREAEEEWQKLISEGGNVVQKSYKDLIKAGYNKGDIVEMLGGGKEGDQVFKEMKDNQDDLYKVTIRATEAERELVTTTKQSVEMMNKYNNAVSEQATLEAQIEAYKIVRARSNKLANESLKKYLEKQQKVYDIEIKLYKLRKDETSQLSDLFGKLAEEGLVGDKAIEGFEKLKKAEGEVLKLNHDYMDVVDDLGPNQRSLVNAFIETEEGTTEYANALSSLQDLVSGGIISQSDLQTIIDMNDAQDNLTNVTQEYKDVLSPLMNDLIEQGIVSSDVADAWADIQDNANETSQATIDLALANSELSESMREVISTMTTYAKSLMDENTVADSSTGILSDQLDLFDELDGTTDSTRTVMQEFLETYGLWDDFGSSINGVKSELEDFFGMSFEEITDEVEGVGQAGIMSALSMIRMGKASGVWESGMSEANLALALQIENLDNFRGAAKTAWEETGTMESLMISLNETMTKVSNTFDTLSEILNKMMDMDTLDIDPFKISFKYDTAELMDQYDSMTDVLSSMSQRGLDLEYEDFQFFDETDWKAWADMATGPMGEIMKDKFEDTDLELPMSWDAAGWEKFFEDNKDRASEIESVLSDTEYTALISFGIDNKDWSEVYKKRTPENIEEIQRLMDESGLDINVEETWGKGEDINSFINSLDNDEVAKLSNYIANADLADFKLDVQDLQQEALNIAVDNVIQAYKDSHTWEIPLDIVPRIVEPSNGEWSAGPMQQANIGNTGNGSDDESFDMFGAILEVIKAVSFPFQHGIKKTSGPTLSMIGEAGAEAVVPLEGANRKYGISILQDIIPKHFPEIAMAQTGMVAGGTGTSNVSNTSSENYNFYGDIVVNEASNAEEMLDAFFDELEMRSRSKI